MFVINEKAYTCTDAERDASLMCATQDREPPHHQFFVLSWEGEDFPFEVDEKSHKEDGEFVGTIWEVVEYGLGYIRLEDGRVRPCRRIFGSAERELTGFKLFYDALSAWGGGPVPSNRFKLQSIVMSHTAWRFPENEQAFKEWVEPRQ